MIRRKIWATATCCLALAGAAKAQTNAAPKATLGAPAPGYVARGAAPGYPQYTPRNYTAPTPPGYSAPVANLGTNPAAGPSAPAAPLPNVEQPMMSQPEVDGSILFAADTVPTVPVQGAPSPIQVNPKGGIPAPMGTPMNPPMQMPTPMGTPMGMPMGVVTEGTPVPTGPLVSGPINGGPIIDGSYGGGTPFLDGFEGGMPKVWASGEYINWRLRGAHVPALVTTAPAGSPGTLNDGGTAALFGGQDKQTDWQSGFRVRGGCWLDNGGGIDVGYFQLGHVKDRFNYGSNGDPGVFRPFFNTSTGAEDASLIAFIDPIAGPILAGRVSIRANTELWGAEANYRTGWTTGLGGRLDCLIGYRYVQFRDTLAIQSDATTNIAAGAAPVGTNISIFDRFEAKNQFNGGQIGLVGEWQTGSMTFGLRAQVAAGVNTQRVDIYGGSNSLAPGGTLVVAPGGLLALPSNIGSHDRNVFSVVSEVGATVGYQLTSSLRVFGGYNVMAMTNTVRAGEQINRNVNGTFIPDPTTGTASGTGPANPLFHRRDSDFYLHGWTAGLEWRW